MSSFEKLIARHQRPLGAAQAAVQRPGSSVRGRPARAPSLRHLCTITCAEIRYGIERLTHAARRQDVAPWLERTLRPLLADRTLAIGEDVILRWGQMLEAGRRRGRTFSQPDLFVAAVAALEDLVVASRDTREFVAAEVPVLDPWSGSLTLPGGHTVPLGELARADILARASVR